MIETVVSANMLIGEVMRVKKNHLAPDFPTGKEKRLCIVSGIHGDEVAGQYICYELIRRIKKDFDKLTGIVDVYPFVNPMGLEAQYRDVPVFDIDMNTLFPGSKDGTVGEYTAANIMKDIEGADICIDVHSSSVYIKEIPQVRVNSDVASDVAPYAACMNVDVVWIHPSSTVMEGSLAHALNEAGVKSMVVESGVALKIDYDYSNQIVDGLFSLMCWKRKNLLQKLEMKKQMQSHFIFRKQIAARLYRTVLHGKSIIQNYGAQKIRSFMILQLNFMTKQEIFRK